MKRRSTFVLTTVVALTTVGAGPGPVPNDPSCVAEHLLEGPGTPGTLVWEESGEITRRVTVFFDSSGEPIQYTEMKASAPLDQFDREGPYRLIHVDFGTGFAVVESQGPDGHRIQEQRDIPSVLQSSALGTPSETIQQVKSMCLNL
jgi:hypothetical protein